MNGSIRGLALVIHCALGFPNLMAQGSGDAGAGQLGPIGLLELERDTANQFSGRVGLGYSYGIGERDTRIARITADVHFHIGDRVGLHLSIPYVSVQGELSNKNANGDPIMSASYEFLRSARHSLTGILGVRIPLGPTRLDVAFLPENGQLDLPMCYQPGLGSTDVLFGINWRRDRFRVGVVFQHVLTDNNKNQYYNSGWAFHDRPGLDYTEGRYLRRADDAVLRVQYVINHGSLYVRPGLLGIYHLKDDERVQGHPSSPLYYAVLPIADSEGLTLNWTADIGVALGKRVLFEASFTAPIVQRALMPDGLSRSWVAGSSVSIRF